MKMYTTARWLAESGATRGSFDLEGELASPCDEFEVVIVSVKSHVPSEYYIIKR